MSDPAAGARSPLTTDPKRALIGFRRRQELLRLVADYSALLPRYPTLQRQIRGHIDELLAEASRTPEQDTAAVLGALDAWKQTGLSVDDLVDDTKLAAASVRLILDDLLSTSPPQVQYVERSREGERGRRNRIYFPISK